MFESQKILSVNSHEKVLKLHLKSALPQAVSAMMIELERNQITPPQVLFMESDSATAESFLWITGPAEIVDAIQKMESSLIKVASQNYCSVTATVTGNSSPEIQSQFCQTLGATFHVEKIVVNPMSLTAFMPQPQRQAAIVALSALAN